MNVRYCWEFVYRIKVDIVPSAPAIPRMLLLFIYRNDEVGTYMFFYLFFILQKDAEYGTIRDSIMGTA